MKMFLTLAFSYLMVATSAFAQVNYSNTTDIDRAHSNIRITDARYFAIATRTEVRQIPGCNPHGERHPSECEETVVLERTPVVQVTVSYTEGIFRDPDFREGHLYFNFKLSDFDVEEVEKLRAASGLWDFTGRKYRIRKAFAKKYFELRAELVSRTIQIVDVRNSRLCPIGESGEPRPGCVEELRYKPVQIKVHEVTVLKK